MTGTAAADPGPQPGPARTEKGEAARLRILDAAETAFAEQGFAGTSLRSIGAAIGMGNAALLHHFPNKRRLYAAVLQRIAAELEASLLQRPGTDDLQAIAEAFLAWSVNRPQAGVLILRELLDNPPRAERARTWPMQGLMRRLGSAAAAAARSGPMAAQDPLILAFQVIGAVAYICAGQRTIAAIMEIGPAEVIDRLRPALRAQIAALTGMTASSPPAGDR